MQCTLYKNRFHNTTSRLQKKLDNTSWIGYYLYWKFNSHLLLKYSTTSKNALSLNYVSTKNLLSPRPPSIFKYPEPSNLDHQVWLDSYNEKKQGLIDHVTYKNISKTQYIALKVAGNIPKSIPSMCILVVKNNKDSKTLRSKSCIFIMGNFEDRIYQK